MAELVVGDVAPDFSGSTQDGDISLSALRGKTVVLFFYPKDNTPGCTKEACGFQENLSAITDAGGVVIGVSADSAASHKKFADKFGLTFPLLVDQEKAVIEAYDAWGEKSMYGKKYMGIIRRTIVIGPDGKVLKVFPKVSPAKHAAEILELLGAG